MDVGCVIKELEESIAFFRDRVTGDMFDKWLRASVDALALLKAQEPVEPILKREARNKYHNDYVCPLCDQELVYEQNYCSECGRAVKWE